MILASLRRQRQQLQLLLLLQLQFPRLQRCESDNTSSPIVAQSAGEAGRADAAERGSVARHTGTVIAARLRGARVDRLSAVGARPAGVAHARVGRAACLHTGHTHT